MIEANIFQDLFEFVKNNWEWFSTILGSLIGASATTVYYKNKISKNNFRNYKV